MTTCSPSGGPLRLRNWRSRVFDPATRRVGLVDVTPRDLRHTAASLAIASGAHVKVVQQMLGHASAAMTLDVYAGLLGGDLDSLAEALDRVVPQMCHTGSNSATEQVAPDEPCKPLTCGSCFVGRVGLEPTTQGL
jgi:site-specific recombinase XerC